MKAVAYYQNLPIEAEQSLLDITLPEPVPGAHDLLVEVHAVSVNPVDVKMRAGSTPPTGQPRVLGWDAAGVVRSVGADVTLFRPGERVWYAGDLLRPGSNAELQLVDERLVGPMPQTLDFAAAAALPLTTITAWELLFDRLQIAEGTAATGQVLLIIGAAGGVGSILVQLARQLTGLTVIGTASRAETAEWVRDRGAHHVIDHHRPWLPQLQALGIGQVDCIAGLNQSDQHFDQMVEVIRPQGRLALIDDPESLDVRKLKRKSVSLHWELMFTRSMYQTDDMIRQHALLERVATLVDDGILKTTLASHFGTINASNLKRAHAQIERNATRGKIVLAGF
ncbi:zinc-binding alcohol dehydrogenase family protein [Paludibacterium sp. THUN1379]|uniref:zinc-binding alcohol dehydrogenase family protein n=1 Tax=Paludibacterium sp. THUN1379 TaxID=3112107 RepID=UPI00308553D5|nr:zinc-binding alcohol dehydrogenase family protein [Paludibacterium sp. THUN1379]